MFYTTFVTTDYYSKIKYITRAIKSSSVAIINQQQLHTVVAADL